MSYDVLAVLRRRLVAERGGDRDDRPSGGPTRPGPAPPETLIADGGDGDERGGGRGDRDDDEHLRDLPDGAGCAEIWEHLSEHQSRERRAEEPQAEEAHAVECRADD